MIAALLTLFIADPFPSGCYSMPELCRKLTAATSVVHQMDTNVRDYPVFVSVKSGDAARVEKLVATAMHAEWRDDGTGKLRLIQSKIVPGEDLAHFEAAFKLAYGSNKDLPALPIQDVYKMAPGEIIRYGAVPNAYVKKWPVAGRKPDERGLAVRRLTYGVFEFTGMKEANFSWLPDEAAKLLGADADNVVVTDEMKAQFDKMQKDPQSLKLDFTDLDKHDPAATMAELMLPAVGKGISKDLVIALPDFSFFTLFDAANGPGTVRSILSGYSKAIDWTVSDDALIGRLPNIELTSPSQSRRSVIAKFLQGIGEAGVANVAVLSDYVKSQRPCASNSWTDAMMLVLDSVVVDQEYIGDYPFNIRLYTQLSDADWAVLKSGQPFRASQLSIPSQKMLRELLLQSRNCIMGEKPDPGFWSSIAPNDLVIVAGIKEEPVLIGFTGVAAEVYNIDSAAANHDLRLKELGREPLYQPATRRKLEMTIGMTKNEPGSEPIVTGFSEVYPDAKAKKSVWMSLPADMAKQFREALDKYKPGDQGGVPPPR